MQAKLIDVVWDWAIGQGGRLIQAWIVYKVASDALVRLLEHSAVSYDVYASLTFSSASVESLLSIFDLLLRGTGWWPICTGVWLVWATVHVLIFPTVWSAATGYINPSIRVYTMPDGNYVPLSSNNLRPCFQLVDGSRVGLEDNEILLGPPFSSFFPEWSTIPSSGPEVRHLSVGTDSEKYDEMISQFYSTYIHTVDDLIGEYPKSLSIWYCTFLLSRGRLYPH